MFFFCFFLCFFFCFFHFFLFSLFVFVFFFVFFCLGGFVILFGGFNDRVGCCLCLFGGDFWDDESKPRADGTVLGMGFGYPTVWSVSKHNFDPHPHMVRLAAQ